MSRETSGIGAILRLIIAGISIGAVLVMAGNSAGVAGLDDQEPNAIDFRYEFCERIGESTLNNAIPLTKIAEIPNSSNSPEEYFVLPLWLALDGQRDEILVCDLNGGKLEVLDTSGRFLRTIGRPGAGPRLSARTRGR